MGREKRREGKRQVLTEYLRTERQTNCAQRDRQIVARDAVAWDKQFEEDVAAGRLDALADEAIRDLREASVSG